ncbi:MAG: tetratricopeptide repeat protein [Rivularia sp. (in: Bacteria)]|nr:tetratricopeptide repeat protein [Rivularia sp. MS3]
MIYKIIATFMMVASTGIMFLLSGCNIITKFNDQSITENQTPEILTWDEIKQIIKKDTLTVDELNKIPDNRYYSAEIEVNEAKELIKIYEKTKYNRVRIKILRVINNVLTNFAYSTSSSFSAEVNPNVIAIGTDEEILNFYYSVAKSKHPILSAIAVQGIVAREGSDKTWENWSWSKPVLELFEEILNRDMYKLSQLNYYELLNFVERYPESLYIKGSKEYAAFTGDVYFNGGGGLRKPLNPEKEIEIVPQFLKKYSGHPASDDAMYRLARAYEIKGDYENAIFWYEKSSKAPDADLKGVAYERILFIIDLLMSTEQLTNFVSNYPNHKLVPYITYSRAVHLIREKQYSNAISELEIFMKKYDKSLLENLSVDFFDSIYIDSMFWDKVRKQTEQVKKINDIYKKNSSDKKLYNEAKIWLSEDNLFTAYNFLWNGNLRHVYDRFVPKWQGYSTYIESLVSYDFIQQAKQKYQSQISYFIAINILEKILKEYPNSQLADDAKYSIGLAYYYIWARQYPIFTEYLTEAELVANREELVVNSFDKFVEDFPKSPLADDALYSIAYIKKYNNAPDAREVIKRLLKNYPNSDIKSEAEELMRKIK